MERLTISGVIAFDGLTRNGLVFHPDGKHLIYPVGKKIAVKNMELAEQSFLTGHTNTISTICLSPSGEFVASGQISHFGYKATVILWNYKERDIKSTYEVHKVRVEDICFSSDGNYLLSLGGRDDGKIVVWDVHNNEALCASIASDATMGNVHRIMRLNNHNMFFITAGEGNLRIWRINSLSRRIHGTNVKLGKLKRTINCVAVSANDENIYCGTSSGDIIKARLNIVDNATTLTDQPPPTMVGCYSKISTNGKKTSLKQGDSYPGGVNHLLLMPDENIIVGTGDGTVEIVQLLQIPFNDQKIGKQPNTPQLKTVKTVKLRSEVTSMILHEKDSIFIGTSICEMYKITLSDFKAHLLITCHNSAIYGLAFPWNYSEIFATGGKDCVRLWQLQTQKELLRITVPNFICTSLCFSSDGCLIISAWNDGAVRMCSPKTGHLRFAIHNAHVKTVTAMALTMNGEKLMTGGCDGQVRIWKIKDNVHTLLKVFKEHRGPITSVSLSNDEESLVSASTDGTCIIWDLKQYVRKQMLMGKTMFMSASFTPNGLQVLSCGSNRKIGYWEVLDGSLIREIEVPSEGPLNCLDIGPDGKYFISAGNDCVVRLWDYDAADCTHFGDEHAAIITACKFSPDGKHMVTGSADGSIIIWRTPFQ